MSTSEASGILRPRKKNVTDDDSQALHPSFADNI
jgi:hypothetical protein